MDIRLKFELNVKNMTYQNLWDVPKVRENLHLKFILVKKWQKINDPSPSYPNYLSQEVTKEYNK